MSMVKTDPHFNPVAEPASQADAPVVAPAPPPPASIRPDQLSPPPPINGRLARWYDQLEAFVSRLSVRDTFWQRICSLIWLPYAFFSGIRMKVIDSNTYAAVLPFRRFNRNWYHAMAGGALLANSEIAGGMYVFGIAGGDYTVVCKQVNYTFLRPCFGPAVYKMTPRENLREQIAAKTEFNITLDMEISQQVNRPGERDKRVGRCEAIFHVTPKSHHKARKARRLEK
jgi:acyl-coenzyme A thioesterase PaaI-like protein